MHDVSLRDLHLGAEDVFRFVGILFATFVATHFDLIGQHGEGCKGIGFAEDDSALVRRIVLVMESMIFTDDDPEVVC